MLRIVRLKCAWSLKPPVIAASAREVPSAIARQARSSLRQRRQLANEDPRSDLASLRSADGERPRLRAISLSFRVGSASSGPSTAEKCPPVKAPPPDCSSSSAISFATSRVTGATSSTAKARSLRPRVLAESMKQSRIDPWYLIRCGTRLPIKNDECEGNAVSAPLL